MFGRALAVPVMLRQVPSRGEAHGDGEPALLRLVEALVQRLLGVGQATTAPPSSVMNSRRFTARCLRAFDRKDSTPRWGRRLLRCGISALLMTAQGQTRSLR